MTPDKITNLELSMKYLTTKSLIVYNLSEFMCDDKKQRRFLNIKSTK